MKVKYKVEAVRDVYWYIPREIRTYIVCDFCYKPKNTIPDEVLSKTIIEIKDKIPEWFCSEECRQEAKELYGN